MKHLTTFILLSILFLAFLGGVEGVRNLRSHRRQRAQKLAERKNSTSESSANLSKVNTQVKSNNSDINLKPETLAKEQSSDVQRLASKVQNSLLSENSLKTNAKADPATSTTSDPAATTQTAQPTTGAATTAATTAANTAATTATTATATSPATGAADAGAASTPANGAAATSTTAATAAGTSTAPATTTGAAATAATDPAAAPAGGAAAAPAGGAAAAPAGGAAAAPAGGAAASGAPAGAAAAPANGAAAPAAAKGAQASAKVNFDEVVMVPKISPYAKEDLAAIRRNEEWKALGGSIPTYLVSDTVFDETPLIYVDVLKTKVTEAGRPNDDRKIDHLWAGWLGDRLYRNVSFEDPDIPSTTKINQDLDEAFNTLRNKTSALRVQKVNATALPDVVLENVINPIKKNMFETHSNVTVAYNDLLKNLTQTQKETLNLIEATTGNNNRDKL